MSHRIAMSDRTARDGTGFDRTARFLLYALLAGLVVLVRPFPAGAQSTDEGSVYSRFGMGELTRFSSSQIQAMGGGGTALWSLNYANFGNPASWGAQVLTRATVGVRLQSLTATDASDNSASQTSGSLSAVQFSFPLLSNRLGVGLSFEPYSRVNYRVQSAGSLVTPPPLTDTTAYTINYEGRGGLQQVRAGLGYRVADFLRVGASGDLVFGIIEQGQRTVFPGAEFDETNLVTATQYVGLTGTAGALVSIDGLFGETDDLSLGASFTLPVSLSGDRVLTLGESLDRDSLGATVEGSTSLPFGTRFGVAYQAANRWTLTGDVQYEPWSRFESDFAHPGYAPGGSSQFQDRLRFSGGLEVIPAGGDPGAPYLQRVGYRLGFYYDEAYVTPQSGIDLRTRAVTTGLSFPTLLTGTHLDLNLEVGTRGSTDQDMVRDLFYGVSVVLNVGERWFMTRRLR